MADVLWPQNNTPSSLQTPNVDAVPPGAPTRLGMSRGDSWMISREEHEQKERSLQQNRPSRTPKRSQTHADYQLPSNPARFSGTMTIHQMPEQQTSHPPQPSSHHPHHRHGHEPNIFVFETIPEASVLPSPQTPTTEAPVQRPRPALGQPRRSYSVTDQEPQPHFNRLSRDLVLEDLPSDLHFTIFDFLDPIDSTCFGLSSRYFYDIHRRLRGKVPLATRRDGPNELEWAWHLSQRNIDTGVKPSAAAAAAAAVVEVEGKKPSLSAHRIRGQGMCRHCGVSRCELRKHIQDWPGVEGQEYCEIREKFGPAAPEGAKRLCSMSNPQNPSRCSRHRDRKS